jgi:hypothetical protein
MYHPLSDDNNRKTRVLLLQSFDGFEENQYTKDEFEEKSNIYRKHNQNRNMCSEPYSKP